MTTTTTSRIQDEHGQYHEEGCDQTPSGCRCQCCPDCGRDLLPGVINDWTFGPMPLNHCEGIKTGECDFSIDPALNDEPDVCPDCGGEGGWEVQIDVDDFRPVPCTRCNDCEPDYDSMADDYYDDRDDYCPY